MITERADLTITPSREREFEAAMAGGISILAGASGAAKVTLMRCMERPARYTLQIQWNSLADHHAFTKTPQFTEFVGIAGPFFAERPFTEHFQLVSSSG